MRQTHHPGKKGTPCELCQWLSHNGLMKASWRVHSVSRKPTIDPPNYVVKEDTKHSIANCRSLLHTH